MTETKSEKSRAMARARQARYREVHREEIIAKGRAYYRVHKDEAKAYREAHKEEIAAIGHAWYQKHREEVKARVSAYQKEHRGKVNARTRVWYAKHKDEISERKANWRQTPKGRAQIRATRQNRRAKEGKRLSGAVVEEVRVEYGGLCPYCNQAITEGHIDHVIPIASGGTNERGNLVYACAPCNMLKGSKSLLGFMLHRMGAYA